MKSGGLAASYMVPDRKPSIDVEQVRAMKAVTPSGRALNRFSHGRTLGRFAQGGAAHAGHGGKSFGSHHAIPFACVTLEYIRLA